MFRVHVCSVLRLVVRVGRAAKAFAVCMCGCVAVFSGMSSAWKGGEVEHHELSSGDEGAAGSVNMSDDNSDNPFASFAFGGATAAVPTSAPRPSTGNKRKKDAGERWNPPVAFEQLSVVVLKVEHTGGPFFLVPDESLQLLLHTTGCCQRVEHLPITACPIEKCETRFRLINWRHLAILVQV